MAEGMALHSGGGQVGGSATGHKEHGTPYCGAKENQHRAYLPVSGDIIAAFGYSPQGRPSMQVPSAGPATQSLHVLLAIIVTSSRDTKLRLCFA